jgi:hypothetical protein
MNRTLWKFDRIGEHLWMMARLVTAQAAALGSDGRGLAIVAEETQKMTDKVNAAVEKAMFEDEEINKTLITELALQLNLLALNTEMESHRLGHLGKQSAVFAEDIRKLASDIVCLFDEVAADKAKQFAHPWPKHPLTSIISAEYLHLDIGGINILECVGNVQEVCAYQNRNADTLDLRGMKLPFIDCYKTLGKKQEVPVSVIINTPWAEQNKTYAVAADVKCIHITPVGKHIDAPRDMPLAKYVRECWENENGEPFYFMDWPKMV